MAELLWYECYLSCRHMMVIVFVVEECRVAHKVPWNQGIISLSSSNPKLDNFKFGNPISMLPPLTAVMSKYLSLAHGDAMTWIQIYIHSPMITKSALTFQSENLDALTAPITGNVNKWCSPQKEVKTWDTQKSGFFPIVYSCMYVCFTTLH